MKIVKNIKIQEINFCDFYLVASVTCFFPFSLEIIYRF
jgi:hypothetical protein